MRVGDIRRRKPLRLIPTDAFYPHPFA